jgi:hypothetical protein
MLDTPQRYPRAGSQSYPSPAATANADGSTTVYFDPSKPAGISDGNWIQTVPGKGWNTLLRLYSPLEPFFTKVWRPNVAFDPLRSRFSSGSSFDLNQRPPPSFHQLVSKAAGEESTQKNDSDDDSMGFTSSIETGGT